MNYRHGYHAGNFADVLKHTALCELLRLLTAKDKKLFVLDTHAGAGGYDLSGSLARRTGEAGSRHRPLGTAAARRHAGGRGALSRGGRGLRPQVRSGRRPARGAIRARRAWCARRCGRATGSSPASCIREEALALKREFAGDRAVEVRQADGYKALKALLPPVERRGLVLIDPPFEAADEFERLLRALRQGVRRFATGCYAIWYPIKDEAAAALRRRPRLASSRWSLELRLDGVAPGKLAACGLAVINPPWRFEEAMREALPWIAAARAGRQLGRRCRASHSRGSGINRVMTNDTRQSAAPARMAPA